jgi:hypothetical protein
MGVGRGIDEEEKSEGELEMVREEGLKQREARTSAPAR